MSREGLSNYRDLLEEFPRVCELIKQASQAIRQKGFSRYPIFIRSQSKLSLGEALIQKGEWESSHYYYASYLEALSEQGVIQKIKDFQHIYKPPDSHCMLLLLLNTSLLSDTPLSQYVSLPYPEN